MTTAQPTFVFKGTVKKRAAAAAEKTVKGGHVFVVSVDEVLEGGGYLADLVGQAVQVQVGGDARVALGDSLVFHAVPVSFGETVVVRSVQQEPIDRARKRATTKRVAARGGTSSHDLEERLADADLVVSGRVETVKDGVEPRGRITEHAPRWREAIVKVASVHKGSPKERSVTVRFPVSTDVLWHDAPKFEPGQEGVFLLHAAAGEQRRRVYTAPHPGDFQPSSRKDEVESLVSGSASSESS